MGSDNLSHFPFPLITDLQGHFNFEKVESSLQGAICPSNAWFGLCKLQSRYNLGPLYALVCWFSGRALHLLLNMHSVVGKKQQPLSCHSDIKWEKYVFWILHKDFLLLLPAMGLCASAFNCFNTLGERLCHFAYCNSLLCTPQVSPAAADGGDRIINMSAD